MILIAGSYHACALLNNGRVFCCGDNQPRHLDGGCKQDNLHKEANTSSDLIAVKVMHFEEGIIWFALSLFHLVKLQVTANC